MQWIDGRADDERSSWYASNPPVWLRRYHLGRDRPHLGSATGAGIRGFRAAAVSRARGFRGVLVTHYTGVMRRPGALARALGLLLLACAPGAWAGERVIVAFGDSLTAGFGVAPEEAYPALLGARLKAAGYPYRVVNAGVSGDTTAGGLRRVDWALQAKPDIVILELGANDGLRGQNLGAMQANLEALVRRFQAAGARVVLAGMRLPPNYGAYADQFYAVYRAVARSTGATFVPFFLDGVAADARLNQADGIHPTAEGYRLVVERLWPYLTPLLHR